MRTLFISTVLAIAIGCSGSKNVIGVYKTEVSQSSGKETIVGDLRLDQSGSYQAKIGQLEMMGTWTSSNGQVFLKGSDEASKLLPSQYRIDGDRLIAQFEGVDAKHWRFVKTASQSVANR